MERWVLTCRRELLDRTLIWNEPHLLHALREFEGFYNRNAGTRASRTPGRSTRHPNLSPTRTRSRDWTYAAMTDSAASPTSTDMPPDLHG
jgi:hypothetical protein